MPKATMELGFGTALLTIVVAGRGAHLEPWLAVPDATLGACFAAGWLLQMRVWPLSIAALATACDGYAAVWGGIGLDCFTPAYAFLYLGYAVTWAAGRWVRAASVDTRQAWRAAIAAPAAVALAVGIAKSSYYALVAGDTGLTFERYFAATELATRHATLWPLAYVAGLYAAWRIASSAGIRAMHIARTPAA